MAGRVFLMDISDHGPWDPTRIRYTSEEEIDLVRPGLAVSLKLRTVGELDAALQATVDAPSALALYVHENLLDAVKVRWEEMRAELT